MYGGISLFCCLFKKLKTNHTSVLFSVKFVLNKKRGRERLHSGYRGIFTLKKIYWAVNSHVTHAVTLKWFPHDYCMTPTWPQHKTHMIPTWLTGDSQVTQVGATGDSQGTHVWLQCDSHVTATWFQHDHPLIPTWPPGGPRVTPPPRWLPVYLLFEILTVHFNYLFISRCQNSLLSISGEELFLSKTAHATVH